MSIPSATPLCYRAGKDTKYGPGVTTPGGPEQAWMRAVRSKMIVEPKALFDQSGNSGDLEKYPGVDHGFAFPQRRCHDRGALVRITPL